MLKKFLRHFKLVILKLFGKKEIKIMLGVPSLNGSLEPGWNTAELRTHIPITSVKVIENELNKTLEYLEGIKKK